MKTCIKCKEERDEDKFRIYKNNSIRGVCKICDNEDDKTRKKNNRRYLQDKLFHDCEICGVNQQLKFFSNLKKHYKKHICKDCYPEFLREQKNEWCKNETKKNINYRLKKSLASRLRNVMNKDENTTLEYIGCNINFLKEWLQYNFVENMNWDNYGTEWVIDHVIPVSDFDLTNAEQKFLCWNWTNLSPLHPSQNSSKKNTKDTVQIELIKNSLLKFLKEKGSTTKWFSAEKCILLKI